MAITVSNDQSVITGLDTSSLTLSAYAAPAGSDKILVVTITTENTSDVSASSVTFDGVALTFRVGITHDTGTVNRSEIWDLPIGSDTTTGDIVLTWPSLVAGCSVAAVTLIDAAQQAPEATTTGTSTGTTITTSITTLTADAMIIDAISYGNATTLSITEGPDQVEDISVSAGDTNLAAGMSHRDEATAGSYPLGWSVPTGRRLAHSLAAYEAAGGGLTIPVAINHYKNQGMM